MRARAIRSAEPTSMEPTGAPSPFDRQNITVSKPRVKRLHIDAQRHGGVEDARSVEMQRELVLPRPSNNLVQNQKVGRPARRQDWRCSQFQ